MDEARQRIPLGDIDDLDAYVRKIVRALGAAAEETEDLVASGYELACRRQNELRPGESLQAALTGWLESRLRDVWRKAHPEWRRNTRAATSYALPLPTGLAWEHGATTTAGMPAQESDWRLSQRRLRLEIFSGETDLYNPRIVGRFCGTPSAAVIATQTAREIWASVIEERALAGQSEFSFARSLDEVPGPQD